MRPFNLEEALAGKPVVTRDGRKVTEIYHFKTAEQNSYPITAIINGWKNGYDLKGRFIGDSSNIHDLFMAPESIEVWVNVWMDSNGLLCVVSCLSESESNKDKAEMFDYTFIKTEKITIEL